MKKKVISLLLTAAMATTMFAGCGSSSEENTTADNSQTAAPAATETAAEESTEAAAPAVSADGKIAMITDSGDITDESFNQITWETCVAYGDKNGIEYQYYKPAEDTDEERINAIDLAVADGATVIVIEHDLDVIRNADYVIDMGPGGGENGGKIIASGTPHEIKLNKKSITGRYL